MALLMARLYTGNYDVISLRNAYHGMSPTTMGLTAHSTWKYNVAQVGFLAVSMVLQHIRSLIQLQLQKDTEALVQLGLTCLGCCQLYRVLVSIMF